MIQVRDGNRTLQFDGEALATSTSRRPRSPRWIEFNLYKTRSGSYVLSRVGHSVIFHHPECKIARKYQLPESPVHELSRAFTPCEECEPDLVSFPLVCLEQPRYWAQVFDSPAGVLDALYKYDDMGARYLTFVAQRLMEDASRRDLAVAQAYQVETIL